MRVHLPNGSPATKIRVEGEYVIVGSDQNVYIYRIGKNALESIGVLTAFNGDGTEHVQVIDNQYISVFHDGNWTFRECTDGLPVSHTITAEIDSEDPISEKTFIVGAGCTSTNTDTTCVEIYVLLHKERRILIRRICDNGAFIHYDDNGSVVYFDKDQGVLMLWQYRRTPMPIDVQSLLMKSSDAPDGDHTDYIVRQHRGQTRFITLPGYRGAIEINTFSRVCRVVWQYRYVADIITADQTGDCIVYDCRTCRYYTDDADRDISDAVENAIASTTKNGSTSRVNYGIDYPEHIGVMCSDNALYILRLPRR